VKDVILMPHNPVRLSAYAPYAAPDVQDAAWWVALASSLDLDRLWFGQQSSVSVLGGVGYAAGRGHRHPLGTAVTLMPTTTPFDAALDLRSLAQLSDHRVSACFSPGYPAVQTALAGRRWASPLTATREFLTAVRGLLAGGSVDVRGEYVSCTFTSPAPDVSDRVDLGLGVLRPGLARLAGELADCAVTWLASPDHLSTTLVPALQAGADDAGRARPRVVATLHAAPGVAEADAPAVVRRAIGPHLSAPHYRDMLRRDGFDIDGPVTHDHLVGALDRGLVTVGDISDILDRAADLTAAGADEVAVVLHHADGATRGDIADTWGALAGEYRRRARSENREGAA
jgi:5,10-methylenetetrahydromethanopterin reductase